MNQSEYEKLFSIILIINAVFWALIGCECIVILFKIRLRRRARLGMILVAIFCLLYVSTRLSFVITGDYIYRTILLVMSCLMSGSIFVGFRYLHTELERRQKKIDEQFDVINEQKGLINEQEQIMDHIVENLTESTISISKNLKTIN